MAEKKEFKPPKNQLGYVTKSKAGNIIIKVEQDMVLKKGDTLIQRKPKDNLESLLKAGIIDEERFEQRVEKIPDWKLYEVSKIESKE